MPLIVDKEAVRMEILMAFQRCIDSKPLTNVSLRDIAAEANMKLCWVEVQTRKIYV